MLISTKIKHIAQKYLAKYKMCAQQMEEKMRKRTVIALLTACSFAVCAVPVVSGNIVMAEVQDSEENTDGNMYFSSLNAEY